MSDYPKYGTAKIECSKRKCGWTGLETELSQVPHKKMPSAMQNVCPKCGCDSYYFAIEKKAKP